MRLVSAEQLRLRPRDPPLFVDAYGRQFVFTALDPDPLVYYKLFEA